MGLPLSVVLDGANRHDVKLPGATSEHIVIGRPEVTPENPQHFCMDAGYTGSAQTVETRGYTAHIRPRGEERKEKQTNGHYGSCAVDIEGILFENTA